MMRLTMNHLCVHVWAAVPSKSPSLLSLSLSLSHTHTYTHAHTHSSPVVIRGMGVCSCSAVQFCSLSPQVVPIVRAGVANSARCACGKLSRMYMCAQVWQTQPDVHEGGPRQWGRWPL